MARMDRRECELVTAGGALAARLDGTGRDDVIAGSEQKDRIAGRGGDDALYGYGGNDLLLGGSGSDRIFGGDGNDTVSFRDSDVGVVLDLVPDRLSYAYAGETVDAIRGVENIVGSNHGDQLSLRAHVGRLVAGGGDDRVYIDPLTPAIAFDEIRLSGGNGHDVLDLGRVTDDNSYGYTLLRLGSRIVGFEEVRGSHFSDSIYAGDDAVAIHGGTGNDDLWNGDGVAGTRLYGEAGDDVLGGFGIGGFYDGGDGDDEIRIADYNLRPIGAATVDGGAGIDILDLGSDEAGATIDLAGGWFRTGRGSSGTLAGIENVNAGSYDDTVSGDAFANLLIGHYGADVIDGGSGDDVIYADTVRDHDYAHYADSDVDVLTGGAGADRFVFDGQTYDRGAAATLVDLITDFTRSDRDRIVLARMDANDLAAGNQDFTFLGTGNFTRVPGGVRYAWRHGDTYVEIETNGDGAADRVIRLDGEIALTARDFAL